MSLACGNPLPLKANEAGSGGASGPAALAVVRNSSSKAGPRTVRGVLVNVHACDYGPKTGVPFETDETPRAR